MYSIHSASGRFTSQVFRDHSAAYAAFKKSGMIGIAFVVNEFDGVVEYDMISDGTEHWLYPHRQQNVRATAHVSV